MKLYCPSRGHLTILRTLLQVTVLFINFVLYSSPRLVCYLVSKNAGYFSGQMYFRRNIWSCLLLNRFSFLFYFWAVEFSKFDYEHRHMDLTSQWYFFYSRSNGFLGTFTLTWWKQIYVIALGMKKGFKRKDFDETIRAGLHSSYHAKINQLKFCYRRIHECTLLLHDCRF